MPPKLDSSHVGCPSCQLVVVNNVPCHEHGCPASHIDPLTGRPYMHECAWCGRQHDRPDSFCSDECARDYNS